MFKHLAQKPVAVLLLAFFLTVYQPTQARAFAPAIIAAAAIAGSAVVTVGAMSYYKPNSSYLPPGVTDATKTVYTNAGNIGRVVLGAYKQFNQYGQQDLMGGYARIKTNFADVYNYLSSHGHDVYTDLWNVVSNASLINLPPNSSNVQNINVGSIVTGNDGATHQVTAMNYNGYAGNPYCSNATGIQNTSGGSVYVSVPIVQGHCASGAAEYSVVIWWNAAQVPPAVPSIRTPAQIATYVGANPTMPSAAQDQLDTLIPNMGSGGTFNVVDYGDPSTLDSAPPLAYTPPAAAAVNPVTGTVTGLGSVQLVGAQAAATTAHTDLANAQAAVDSYVAAHPGATDATDPALKALDDKLAAAKAADASATKTLDHATEANQEQFPSATIDQVKSIDWSKLKALSGVLNNTFPFNTLAAVPALYSAFSADPKAPVFDFPLPLGKTIHCDLAVFDPVATLCRFLVASLITGGSVFYIVRFWRGVA